MSPKFKKQSVYRREREERQQREVAVEQQQRESRANQWVYLLEQFIEAKVRCMETNAIEDAVSLNKAREQFTAEVVHLIERDHASHA